MEFREALIHYRAGTATDEERQWIEEELEKSRLIAEYEMEQLAPEPEEAPAGEMKQIRRALNRRSRKLIFAAVAVVLALILLANWGVLPFLDRLYFDPEQETICEGISDFDLIMKYQLELHHPGASYFGSYVERTGIGRYRLGLSLQNPISGSSMIDAALDKDELTFSSSFGQEGYGVVQNLFGEDAAGTESWRGEQTETFLEKLKNLPDFVEVTGAVSFGENLSTEALLSLTEAYPEITFWWAGVACQATAPCGFSLPGYGVGYGEAPNEIYPSLEVYWSDSPASKTEIYEEHFISMLRLMKDHPSMVELFGAENYANYRLVLEEIEEQGVNIYGVYVSAAPSALLALMEEENAANLWLLDAKITVY